ncbi:DEAD/DEAH box helicase [Antarcticibacterium flavum]|uniref:DEAD/DEAH box helicase n=1 Tax=Antarcticibacterium flavum TaxID=2058175 RepID=A0A5B7WZW0_9FLAO|nr:MULTISPECIES: DEAD/DEAH box helicase [Antarcticibacterium]MCM4160787.1 DEAD/DEAH box helicase [Antarcticibacterium sp. W02-3]QCY67958.1 DEAD/DEAH box helicase [Antarcticibacterium flavum]
MGFTELGVSDDLIKGLEELGIKHPTPIQEAAIPVLSHQDVDFVGQAQTGTGKTAAFGLPILSRIDPGKDHIQALILAPTRELGQQIARQLFKFTKYSQKVFTEAVYGGEKIDIQISRLSRPTHVVVATPGRLLDLLNKKALDISRINTLVLDEADEMLSMGFKDELTRILKKTSGNRNIWLFSATIPKELDEIIEQYVAGDAVRVHINKSEAVNTGIEHQFVTGDDSNKLDTLAQFLKSQGKHRGIIFTRTKAVARVLAKQLEAKNYEVGLLEGDMMQKDRDKVMRAFKNKSLRILVSTDVAARGIDVDNLAFVVHYQLPDQIDYYTHRSGRTARAGKKGISLVLVNKKELRRIWELEKALGIKFLKIK